MLDPQSRRGFFASLFAAVLAALGWRPRSSPAAAVPAAAPPAAPQSFCYDAIGRTTTYFYDSSARLLSRQEDTGAVFTYTYDSLGRQTGVEGPEEA